MRKIVELAGRAIAGFVVAAALAGCPSNYQPISFLDNFRILSITAEPPEVYPTQSTTITATIFEPEGRQVQVDWAVCTIPPNTGAGQSVSDECVLRQRDPQLRWVGSSPSVKVTMPFLDLRQYALLDTTFGVYVPIRFNAGALGGDAGAPVNHGDLGPPLAGDGGDVIPRSYTDDIVGLFRLRSFNPLFYKIPPNTNPHIADVYVRVNDGAARTGGFTVLTDAQRLEFHVGQSLTFRAAFPDSSREPYCALADKSQPHTQTGPCADTQQLIDDPRAYLEGLKTNLPAPIRAGLAARNVDLTQLAPLVSQILDANTTTVEDVTEIIQVAWFSTAGVFAEDVTAGGDAQGMPLPGLRPGDPPQKPDNDLTTDKYVPGFVPPGGLPIEIYAVARDGRGGQDHAHRTVWLLP